MYRRVAAVLAAATVLLGAAAAAVSSVAPSSPAVPAVAPASAAVRAAAPASAARTSAAAAVSAFGVDLESSIGGSGNLVVSPYSVATVVAMAGAGASGRTATQIADVLHVGTTARIPAVGSLSATLAREQAAAGGGAVDAPQLDLANGLFVQQGFPITPAFTVTLTRGFGAGPQPVDFAQDAPAATAAINQFVATHTAGVIPHVLAPGQLDQSTRLALVNAIYLKAAWLHPFEAAATADAPFHTSRGTRQVRTMSETDSLAYVRRPGYQAVELPYADSTFALLALRPTRGPAALERTLSAPAIDRTLAALRPAEVALRMPSFHVSFAADLRPALERLGMTRAFDPRTADFSGISSTPLYVSLVQHDADFTVDEHGTVAAAATVGGISATAIEVPPKPVVRLDLDRPFLFYLIDTTSRAVIFAGRLSDPTG